MTTNVLFLCTHNSSRSILAEGMLSFWAARFNKNVRAYSAGIAASGCVNPLALQALRNIGVKTSGLRSKNFDEFTAPGAPQMRLVVTVSESAAAGQLPVWPGSPLKAHWGYPDLSNAAEADKVMAFELTRQAMGYRLLQLVDLPLGLMSNAELQTALDAIAAR